MSDKNKDGSTGFAERKESNKENLQQFFVYFFWNWDKEVLEEEFIERTVNLEKVKEG